MKKNYIYSNKYSDSRISLGFFTRKGGFSSKNFSSLNCSSNSGDKNTTVKDNIFQAQKECL